MSELNKTYRIRVGETIGNLKNDYISIAADLTQDYDTFEILSLSINSVDTYKLHNADYGVVVGRVLANNGFGIPNAKISIFIEAKAGENNDISVLYPFSSTASKDKNGVRYNLLPDEKVSDCHQIVGTFPNKRYALDNDVILEVFDKYYKYTTRTNNAGDYLIMGVPTGAHTLHMDLDLSDCGILSQRPRDFVYKGYTIEQFENPNMFKEGTSYPELSQVFTQDQVVNVQPFWGNSSLGETIGITRADIDVSFKFEPTCIFMGSIGSDNASQGISKKCIPTAHMGDMDEMVTGEGTIEMIRKTPGGSVEEFQIKGTQLINGNGVWCYQIPMNLDYMMTDEYGNMVPTDDPEKGIPTRTSVRFRISMQDAEANTDNYFRPKVLVPNNPQNTSDGLHEKYDYEFGSSTQEESFRDLFWNNVYSVKSFIPRFQKRQVSGWKEDKFTGIKHCNYYGPNNPLPYNNIRIKLPFMFIVMCAIFKCFVFLTGIVNFVMSALGNMLADIGNTRIPKGIKLEHWKLSVVWWYPFVKLYEHSTSLTLNVLRDGLCPDLENWYFAPMFTDNRWDAGIVPEGCKPYDILAQTLRMLRTSESEDPSVAGRDDQTSIDYQNNEEKDNLKNEPMCLTIKTDYLISCLEMNLAQEYKVINFDFYNDWINGFIYVPRFMRYTRPKVKFLGITFARAKIKGCMDDTSIFSKSRKYTQQCSMGYKRESINNYQIYTNAKTPTIAKSNIVKENNFHKKKGFIQKAIFGENGGICHEHTTSKKQYVYYLKPCEWVSEDSYTNVKANLFATDIILLGSLNDCDLYGIPQAFKHLSSSSYIMPTNLALTNMDTNGPLYANGETGAICDGDVSTTSLYTQGGSGVTVVSVATSGLSAELGYYSGANSDNLITQYGAQEPSDTIALTEAAGVSWNWTGPGQGEIQKEKMYYPGGHFLGLSCLNSETNIKSCINLERICELGATMSQRKEDIYGFDDKNGILKYAYTVPTGFISGDEIVDTEFRTMFATMNRKRLIASKINEENGYKMYDFTFLRPNNFDGSFKSIVGDGAPYNINIAVADESDKLKKYNILDASKRADNDTKEGENTQTRTKESTSFDYYMFRFGYNINELRNGNLQERRFLATSNGYKYLPQYENSYYFYFGMKFGATAIDEFNKEFFSNCETQSLLIGEPSVTLSSNITQNSFCNAAANIHVVTKNMETPLESVEWKCSTNPEKSGKETKANPSTIEWRRVFESGLTSFDMLDFSFGEYTIIFVDANGASVTKSISVGLDIISFDSTIYNYNSLKDGPIEFRGGYVDISNLDFKIESFPNSVIIELARTDNNAIVSSKEYHTGDTIRLSGLTLTGANPYYESSYKLQLRKSSSCNPIALSTFMFKHPNNVNLFMGFKNILSANVSSDKFLTTTEGFKTGWWIDKIDGTETDEKLNWLYKKSFFDTNIISGTVFDTHLFTENGDKSLWGYPQQNTTEEKAYIYDKVLFARDFENIPGGYVLDDEVIYFPIVSNDATKNRQYSCTVINDNVIGSNYHGYAIGSTNTLSDDDKTYYTGRTICGYVFKDLNDNELEFRILGTGYDSDLTHSNTAHQGVYYPTFIFPVLDRPFSANTDAFLWSDKNVLIGDSGDGERSVIVSTEEHGFVLNVHVINGITDRDGQFSSSVRVDYWTVDSETATTVRLAIEYGSGKPNTEAQKNDTYGLLSNTYNERKYADFIKKGSVEISGLTTIATFIEEWYPSDIIFDSNKNKTNILSFDTSLPISSTFYDDIAFKLNASGTRFDEKGEIKGYGTTSKCEYFICRDNDGNDDNSIIINKHIALSYGRDSLAYISCIYNEKAEYDDNGASTIATITYKGILTYNITKDDGITKETKEVKKLKNLFNAIINEANIDGLWPTDIEISPVYKANVNTGSTVFTKNTELGQKIMSQRVPDGGEYYSNRKYYGVGKYETTYGTVWKIYPYASPIIVEKELSIFNVVPSEKNVEWPSGSFEVEVSSTIGWTASTEVNWLHLSKEHGTGDDSIRIKYDKNESIERSANVFVKNAKGYEKKVLITQEKMVEKYDIVRITKNSFSAIITSATFARSAGGGKSIDAPITDSTTRTINFPYISDKSGDALTAVMTVQNNNGAEGTFTLYVGNKEKQKETIEPFGVRTFFCTTLASDWNGETGEGNTIDFEIK